MHIALGKESSGLSGLALQEGSAHDVMAEVRGVSKSACGASHFGA